MDTLDVDYTRKDGTVTAYTGVLVSTLLEQAGAEEGATLVLVAADGYTAEIALADVHTCDDCIVAFDPKGGLRTVMPDQSGKVQVKDLVEIQIQGSAKRIEVWGNSCASHSATKAQIGDTWQSKHSSPQHDS